MRNERQGIHGSGCRRPLYQLGLNMNMALSPLPRNFFPMTREHDDVWSGIEHDPRNFSVTRHARLRLLASFRGSFFQ